jgi:adenine-specific DNA-methyltransferase
VKDKRIENRKKLQSLLRDLFQFDHADLDFGIYRIMNQKRREVERFVEEDLLDIVEEALSPYQQRDREEKASRLQQLRRDLGDVIDDSGEVVWDKVGESPLLHRAAKEYEDLRAELEREAVAEEIEARVFNDLHRFFNRYYDAGDFLTKRRYSSRGATYCVPYNGEEVMLYWANRDQYYVKSSERFTDYRFVAGRYTVWFRLEQADVPQNNAKSEARYFVLHDEQQVVYDEESATLTIPFTYRSLSDDEEDQYVTLHNELKSDDKSQLKREYVCEALEHRILSDLEDPTLKASLAASASAAERSLLYYHLNRYTALRTMDYFVHKNLGRFLHRELDVFLKTEVMNLDDVMSDESGEMTQNMVTRMNVVRDIAHKVICFLAQIEDYQRRLFEKKKFVVQTDYCITLDRLAEQLPDEMLDEILDNEDQLNEWNELYSIEAWSEEMLWQGEFKFASCQVV